MKTFRHYNANSLRQASALLARHKGKARVNAGGTDILGALKDRIFPEHPEALVNIKTVPRLEYIRAGKTGLRIGALTRLSDIVKSPAVQKDYPLLAEAARSVAGPNLRNMATVGGNLAQDVRCWYYRYPRQIGGPIECLRKGGRTCGALLGDHRYHSIFGAAPAVEGRCENYCPAHIRIPEYLRHLQEGRIAEAARVLMNDNPFPAITGRVCPVYCEPQCNRSGYDDPVAIHTIERSVGDYILSHAPDFYAPPEDETGKRIAVVGSGPAGLAAAYYLRRSGHQVTVYEKLPEAGGMLLYSIPPYRLPKAVVRNQVRALQGMGIQFEVGKPVGPEEAARIQGAFDAVFVAAGAWISVKLGVPGEDAPGVCYALEYLKKVNSGERPVLGRRVVVIGGGSVALDAARTARRTGCEEVHVVCLETRDLASKDRMPALDLEIQQAEEEGIILHPSLGISKIIVVNGRAAGIETRKCLSVRDPDGTFNPRYDAEAPSPSLPADSVIIAVGQTAEPSPFAPSDKVFEAGDMVEGPSKVIQAVVSARRAVRDIERTLRPPRPEPEPIRAGREYSKPAFHEIPRTRAEAIPAAERIRSFEIEDVPDLDLDLIKKEAERCISCGCLAVGPSDLAVALVALEARVVTTKRNLPAQVFFAATAHSTTVLEQDELIREIRIPRPPKGARQSYIKFTLRKPIDFAIVSVASVIAAEDGVCRDARIALGAVAPAPLRARAAENSLLGRVIDEHAAADAAALAVAEAKPLAMNAYKTEIARILVRRSILGVSC